MFKRAIEPILIYLTFYREFILKRCQSKLHAVHQKTHLSHDVTGLQRNIDITNYF